MCDVGGSRQLGSVVHLGTGHFRIHHDFCSTQSQEALCTYPVCTEDIMSAASGGFWTSPRHCAFCIDLRLLDSHHPGTLPLHTELILFVIALLGHARSDSTPWMQSPPHFWALLEQRLCFPRQGEFKLMTWFEFYFFNAASGQQHMLTAVPVISFLQR